MPLITIRNHRTGDTIYSGKFATARSCLEQAVRDRASLDFADLRHANLSHACLDDIRMRHARLDNANLTGANISESDLQGTAFINTALCSACLCLSSLDGCDFTDALFGGTDIEGASLHLCIFTTESALHLDFHGTSRMDRCRFIDNNGNVWTFSKPPLTVKGLEMPVTMLDKSLKIGATIRPYADWLGQANDNALKKSNEIVADTGNPAEHFFQENRALMRHLIKTATRDGRKIRIRTGDRRKLTEI